MSKLIRAMLILAIIVILFPIALTQTAGPCLAITILGIVIAIIIVETS